jgi:D-aminopeptidase
MKRIERLVAEPKLEFKDPEYETARSEMTEKVADAVEQGITIIKNI